MSARRVPPWVVFAAVLAPAGALRWAGVVPPGTPSPLTEAIGAALGAAGIALAVWSVYALSRFDGRRPVQRGPFRFSRHPMYLAMLLVLTAAGAGAAEWVVLGAVPVLAVLLDRLVVRPEEAELVGAFGDAYSAYARSVRRWL